MKRQIEAVYENGVLRPLEQLSLQDSEQVTITVHSGEEGWLDSDYVAMAQMEGDPAVTIATVRTALAAIQGSLSDVVIDERGEY
jgi:predicted DNA-binding antitoxin AbrB/MazE fold protein